MGIILNDADTRSELQKRVAAELQAKSKVKMPDTTEVDGVEDSSYIENTRKTTSIGWLWIVVVVIAVIAVVSLVIASSR